jgi:single-strand DNA-binding protein
MGNLNKVMIIGRISCDIEKRVTQSGSSVVSLDIATNENYKDQQGNRQERTEFHKVVLWNKLADLAEQYLGKGKQVYIEGSLRTNEWKDKDGNKRYTTEIIGQTMQFIDSQTSNGQGNQNRTQKDVDGYPKNTAQRNPTYGNQNQANQNYQHKSQIDEDFIDDDSIPY